MKRVYFYEGPIYRFNKCLVDNIYFETEAVSEAQAINNIKAKCKRYLGYNYSASIDIDEDAVLPIIQEPKGQLCPKCGKVYLNDAGDCPVCDLGDEYVLDDYLEESLDKNPIKYFIDAGIKVSKDILSGSTYLDENGYFIHSPGSHGTSEDKIIHFYKENQELVRELNNWITYHTITLNSKHDEKYVLITKEPNEKQYEQLTNWLDKYFNELQSIEVNFQDSPLGKYMGRKTFRLNIDSVDDIIKYIKKFYNTGELEEKIVKKGNKYQVQSEKGRNMGTYDTEEEAKKRLQQIEYFKHLNEEVLTETKRSQIISQSKSGQKYKDGKGNRWDAKKDCSVANTTKDYNKIDMNTFWKEDILNFEVKVKGLNDIYSVSISFNDALKYIQKQVKQEDNKWNRDIVTKALMLAINNGDVKVNCTCADFKHRFAYIATKKGYKAGEAENRASDETNPEDTLGAACKHILAALNNASWLRNIASVIVNYANYAKESMKQNYDRFIFPKIFNMTAKQAEEQINDEELASDEATINLSIALGKSKAHFKKDSNESLAENLAVTESLDNPRDLDWHFDKHCEISPNYQQLKKERNQKTNGRYGATELCFTKDEIKSKQEYYDLAYWFAEQKSVTELHKTYFNIPFDGVIMQTKVKDHFKSTGDEYTLYIQTCETKRKVYNPFLHKDETVLIVCYWFYDSKTDKKKVKTIFPIVKSDMSAKNFYTWLNRK